MEYPYLKVYRTLQRIVILSTSKMVMELTRTLLLKMAKLRQIRSKMTNW